MNNYIVVKPTKSLGISILLTLLFGPIGLFYASITGGLIMTLLPVVLGVYLFLSVFSGDPFMFFSSLGSLVIYGVLGWIVCLIWAAISITNYNDRIQKEAQQIMVDNGNYDDESKPKKRLHETVVAPTKSVVPKNHSHSERPTPKEWLQMNPGKNLNDYYSHFRSSY